MSHDVTLGGRVFELPSLRWRVIREIQPGLLGWIDSVDIGADGRGLLRLKPGDLDALADLVFKAVKESPQASGLTREQFDDLPITSLEMAQAVSPILAACGLKFDASRATAGADPKA